MQITIGVTISVMTLLLGFFLMGGDLVILWNPKELSVITLCTLMSFYIASNKALNRQFFQDLKIGFAGGRYNKALIIDMMTTIYRIFITHKREGSVSMENVISDPAANMIGDSVFFRKFPHLMDVIADNLRLYIMDSTRTSDYIAGMYDDLAIYSKMRKAPASLLHTISEFTPGLGIVVAVLGIIRALSAIDGPMDILGHMISEALVGTMFGVWVCYSVLSPLAMNMEKHAELDICIYEFIITALNCHMSGLSPMLAVEVARRNIPHKMRPSYQEVEEALVGG